MRIAIPKEKHRREHQVGCQGTVASRFTQYQRKLRTAEEAVRVVKSGDRVYYGGTAAIPMALIQALESRHLELENVELLHIL